MRREKNSGVSNAEELNCEDEALGAKAVRQEIRQERKARREAFGAWAPSITGLVTAVTGHLAYWWLSLLFAALERVRFRDVPPPRREGLLGLTDSSKKASGFSTFLPAPP